MRSPASVCRRSKQDKPRQRESKIRKLEVTIVNLAGEYGNLSEFGFHGETSFLFDLSHDTPPQAAKQTAKNCPLPPKSDLKGQISIDKLRFFGRR